jgi:hypothetical protein
MGDEMQVIGMVLMRKSIVYIAGSKGMMSRIATRARGKNKLQDKRKNVPTALGKLNGVPTGKVKDKFKAGLLDGRVDGLMTRFFSGYRPEEFASEG